MSSDLKPVSCRLCPAKVVWAYWPEKFKKLPMEAEPSESGPWVLVRDTAHGLVAVPWEKSKHPSSLRYRSHFERCRPSPEKVAAKRKPDPTAGMKFPKSPPRRGQVGPFPPLAELLPKERSR